MKEIGSEFWTINTEVGDNHLNFLNIGKDYQLLMSGRSAIDYVLNDFNDDIKIVYMPDYCCESMVQPFLDNNYEIKYYKADVINNKYSIDLDTKCSVFFAMSYFGYTSSNMDDFIEKFNQKGIIVIEDITHRLLCNDSYCHYSTYLIASLRKWFPIISGGLAVNVNNQFKNDLSDYIVEDKFVDMKLKAMNLKRDYINNQINDKKEYLELFSQSNEMILNYKHKKIDDVSINILRHLDIDKIKKNRIDNCFMIENMLKDDKNIKLLYRYQKGDCPLFVPILLNNRDQIRNELINNNIYLPIHWPNFNNFENDIYDLELSLINDQRYNDLNCEEYIKVFESVVDKVID